VDDRERIFPFLNITKDEIDEKGKKNDPDLADFVMEHIHEFADHHLSEKSAPAGKIFYHEAQHGYVSVKDSSSDVYKCEKQSEGKQEVLIPKDQLSSSIMLTLRVTGQKEENPLVSFL